jgi:cardiolipin synthase
MLVFLPIVGFILYLLLGRQIQRKHIFKLKKEDRKGLAMIENMFALYLTP